MLSQDRDPRFEMQMSEEGPSSDTGLGEVAEQLLLRYTDQETSREDFLYGVGFAIF